MEYEIWSTIHLRASCGNKFHQLATSSRLLIFSQKPSYQSTFAGHTAEHASDSPGELTLELPRPCKHRWHMSYPCHPLPVLADVRWGCQVHQSRCLAARARRPADASSSAAAMRRPRSGWSDLLGCGRPPVPTNGSTEIRIIQTPCRFPGKKMGVWKYGTQGTFKSPGFSNSNIEPPPVFYGSMVHRPKAQVSQAMLLLVQKHQAFQDLSPGTAPQQGTWLRSCRAHGRSVPRLYRLKKQK